MAARSKLSAVPTAALQAEIQRRQDLLPKLIKERDELDARIAVLEGLTGQPAPAAEPTTPARKPGRKPGRKAKRVKNTVSLPDALVAAFAGKKQMGVAEAADAVKAGGYKTNSKIFNTIVNQTLCKDKRFKKAGRGVYVLKGKPGRKAKGKPSHKPGRKPRKAATKAPEAPKTPEQAPAQAS